MWIIISYDTYSRSICAKSQSRNNGSAEIPLLLWERYGQRKYIFELVAPQPVKMNKSDIYNTVMHS